MLEKDRIDSEVMVSFAVEKVFKIFPDKGNVKERPNSSRAKTVTNDENASGVTINSQNRKNLVKELSLTHNLSRKVIQNILKNDQADPYEEIIEDDFY